MTPELFKYALTIFYVVIVYYLSWVGMRRTRDIKGFSIGNKDMNPYLIGITLSASIASTATFVINPGFVYVHGLSAFLHYGVSATLGVLAAFLVLTKGFLRQGEKNQAITIPEWIFHRYQSKGLRFFFALINLFSITFVVLILVGCSLLMTGMFPVEQKTALIIILLFVFSYVLMGGTYAHAYTNTLQGVMMLLIALLLSISGFKYFDQGVWQSLQSLGGHYSSIYNPDSSLYNSFFSVFVSGFIVTFALMLQPHILTKVLYLKSETDINKFIATTVVVGFCFSLMLLIGFYARLAGVDAVTQDTVVKDYLLFEFSQTTTGSYLLVFVFISLLAAGMSTLDGILVSLSAMVVNDIVKPLTGSTEQGLLMSRLVLVAVGIIGVLLAWNPPALIGLFAQKGVYALAAASMAPIVFGVLYPKPIAPWIIWVAAFIGVSVHLYLNMVAGIENPAVSASYAILLSMAFSLISIIASKIVFSVKIP